ncbi:MAG: Fe-S oxidoreductase [Planctomycetota bacterium]|nr:MAG: Fe-S oxidoreductase [Planctomycetota bacterium]
MNVALFITCLTDTFSPRAGVAVVRVLRHFGCNVSFPEAQTCCGQPHYNNGYHAEAARLGRRLIDAFEGHPHVVTPSGSCAALVKLHLPHLLEHDRAYAARAKDLAQRTWEFGMFVTKVLKADLSRIPAPAGHSYTVHYSCHMRELADPTPTCRLVSDLPGADYRPLERLDVCCGFGGAFNLQYPEISDGMTRDKVEHIRRTGATTLVCNEAGCGMTIGGTAHRLGTTLRIRHIAEVWAEGLGLMGRD